MTPYDVIFDPQNKCPNCLRKAMSGRDVYYCYYQQFVKPAFDPCGKSEMTRCGYWQNKSDYRKTDCESRVGAKD